MWQENKVIENEAHEILWDYNPDRRVDLVLINNTKKNLSRTEFLLCEQTTE